MGTAVEMGLPVNGLEATQDCKVMTRRDLALASDSEVHKQWMAYEGTLAGKQAQEELHNRVDRSASQLAFRLAARYTAISISSNRRGESVVTLDDVRSEINVVTLEALSTYDPTTGVPVTTYVSNLVNLRVPTALENLNSAVRAPRSQNEMRTWVRSGGLTDKEPECMKNLDQEEKSQMLWNMRLLGGKNSIGSFEDLVKPDDTGDAAGGWEDILSSSDGFNEDVLATRVEIERRNSNLSELQKSIQHLCLREGRSVREASEMLGIKATTVRVEMMKIEREMARLRVIDEQNQQKLGFVEL